ncbi:hypothetical protein [Streptomyces sp. NPDC088400]|uniref:hypothetical protein n=1 Tax=Streptomyces sp. NPDC088400 TaxID=3365861 RepID=UPI0038293FA0
MGSPQQDALGPGTRRRAKAVIARADNSQTPRTSITSLITGLHPLEHGVLRLTTNSAISPTRPSSCGPD